MTKLQVPVLWQDISHWGKANKTRDFPRPERVKVRNALRRVHLPYKEIVAYINPAYMGGRMQWLDFAVWIPSKRRMGVIMFEAKWGQKSTTSTRSKNLFAVKQQFLRAKKIPVLILPRYYATDEYELLIMRWVKAMATKREEAGQS